MITPLRAGLGRGRDDNSIKGWFGKGSRRGDNSIKG